MLEAEIFGESTSPVGKAVFRNAAKVCKKLPGISVQSLCDLLMSTQEIPFSEIITVLFWEKKWSHLTRHCSSVAFALASCCMRRSLIQMWSASLAGWALWSERSMQSVSQTKHFCKNAGVIPVRTLQKGWKHFPTLPRKEL